MKKIKLSLFDLALIGLFILFLFLNHTINRNQEAEANCPKSSIHFQTQAQIDLFQSQYPNCSEIEGSVLIKGPDIDHLQGLCQLKPLKDFYTSTKRIA